MNNRNDRAAQDTKPCDMHERHKPAPASDKSNTDAKSQPGDWLMRRFMAVA